MTPDRERDDDWRHAEMMSLMANINRNTKARPEPFTTTEFLSWWHASPAGAASNEPVDLGDAKAQSDLIKAMMFGKTKGNSA
ncbi:MAG TPA: hypothetical protein VNZ65_11430 [Collimonas sp.]|jgi:hypothetical protein|nr:hypothetical protein [Collimonas sp.]HWX01437.1 hypothetical protein [Collimonas sp.]